MLQELRSTEFQASPHLGSTRVEYWPIDTLVPYARNPRKNDSAVSQMAASIREFKIPCLVRSNGEVIDGYLLCFQRLTDLFGPGFWIPLVGLATR